MDEFWKKRTEIEMQEIKKRLDTHDNLHQKNHKDILMLQDIAKSNKEILDVLHKLADYAQKTYDVFEPLARYGTKIAKIGAIFIVAWQLAASTWHYIKLIYAKLMLFT